MFFLQELDIINHEFIMIYIFIQSPDPDTTPRNSINWRCIYIYISIFFGVNIKTNDGERELHELFATG